MLILPIETPGHIEDMLVIILDRDNLDRIAKNDPAEVPLRRSGKKLINPTVTIAFDDGSAEFKRLVQSRDIPAILKYLSRGFEFRPDKGDHDAGPQKLSDLQ